MNAPGDAEEVKKSFEARSFWAGCAPWPPPPAMPLIGEGAESLRVALPGLYEIGFVEDDVVKAVSAQSLRVEACGDSLIDEVDHVVETPEEVSDENDAGDVWFSAPGVFATTGKRALVVRFAARMLLRRVAATPRPRRGESVDTGTSGTGRRAAVTRPGRLGPEHVVVRHRETDGRAQGALF